MKKILIAEDRPETRELVAVTLSEQDFLILEAKSGKEALEVARREIPDLLILDVMMPGELDGYDVCRELKARPETGGIPILMLTAKGQAADRTRGLESGAEHYFTKPFSPLQLLQTVDAILADEAEALYEGGGL